MLSDSTTGVSPYSLWASALLPPPKLMTVETKTTTIAGQPSKCCLLQKLSIKTCKTLRVTSSRSAMEPVPTRRRSTTTLLSSKTSAREPHKSKKKSVLQGSSVQTKTNGITQRHQTTNISDNLRRKLN